MKLFTVENFPTTDEEAVLGLPDADPVLQQACRGLYLCRRLQGRTIAEAMGDVLTKFIEAQERHQVAEAAKAEGEQP